MKLRTNKTLE